LKAIAAVAHPDDCVIFAWPFIQKFKDWDWSIVYLTYDLKDDRAQEAATFWNLYDIKTKFLGFQDHYRDLEANELLTFDVGLAEESLTRNIRSADLILTHNEDGDYGHIHHKFVNECANKTKAPKVYFASTFNNNYELVAEPVDLAHWPIHREVIEGFQNCNIGRYYVSEQAQIYL